ncbi:unnamed protein product [Phytophthora lilii]|uniref:Unnamed protein product n=1 Tax=Phytophthora lilii TaxID=2077276 RepID=A0A9W6TVJ8_9STRA|nr:unnamed protein product [Phytophthora lilii]
MRGPAQHHHTYFPEFWMDYKMSEVRIDKLSVVAFKSNSKYYPPAVEICPNGTMGCQDNCEKSEACTLREADGKDCLVIAMMKPGYDRGYFQTVVSNIGIPAYFCFIGYDEVNQYASDAAQRDYRENGYGEKKNNPVIVDFPSMQLTKIAASIVKDLPAGSLFSKLTLSDTDINILLSNNNSSVREIQFAWKLPNPGNTTLPYECDGGVSTLPDIIATSHSCDWIFDNQRTWSGWIDKKPACDSTFTIITFQIATPTHTGSSSTSGKDK